MKVDGTTSHQATASHLIDPNREQGAANTQRHARSGTDQVEISSEATLLSRALRAAGSTPEVRQGLVAQMQAELADGRIGNDHTGLANSIIDHLLDP